MKPNFTETPIQEKIHNLTMFLIAVDNRGQQYASGTAFIIAPGWALSAFHVFEDFIERFDGAIDPSCNHVTGFRILAAIAIKDGTDYMPVTVLRVWRSEPLDLAVLRFGIPDDWPDDYQWEALEMDLLPPRIGTPLVAFGFSGQKFEISESGSLMLNMSPCTSTGVVTEVHHMMRDSLRMPFPCFRTNARFDGGMSGGPVFNNLTGRVCGIICSSIPANCDDEDHISYVSTLWPIVATMVDATDTAISGGVDHPLYHYFNTGLFKAENLSNVWVRSDELGHISPSCRYSLTEWEQPDRVNDEGA